MRNYVKGFVVGAKEKSGEHVWYVKVQEEASVHDGMKCIVVDRKVNFTLQPGLEVEFELGQPEGASQLFAHNVSPIISRVESEEEEQRDDETSKPVRELAIVVTKFRSGEVLAELIWCISREEIEKEWHHEMPGEAEVIGYLPFADAFSGANHEEHEFGTEELLHSLACVPSTRNTLESLLTNVYRLNRTENKD